MNRPIEASLEWEGGEVFRARAGEHEVTIDGEAAGGLSPMQHLALGIAGCMGIDVAHILGKMRTPPETLTVRIVTERAAEPPRRFVAVILEFDLRGEVPEANLARALDLSRDRYCSAWATIRPDVELTVRSAINSPPDA